MRTLTLLASVSFIAVPVLAQEVRCAQGECNQLSPSSCSEADLREEETQVVKFSVSGMT